MFSRFLNKSVSILLLTFITKFTLAATVICPSSSELTGFEHYFVVPYGYHSAEKSIKYLALEGYENQDRPGSGWALLLYPVHATVNENIGQVIESLLPELKPATATALNLEIGQELPIPFCVYDLEGSTGINAIAYYFDEDSLGELLKVNKIENAHVNKLDFKAKIKHVAMMLK